MVWPTGAWRSVLPKLTCYHFHWFFSFRIFWTCFYNYDEHGKSSVVFVTRCRPPCFSLTRATLRGSIVAAHSQPPQNPGSPPPHTPDRDFYYLCMTFISVAVPDLSLHSFMTSLHQSMYVEWISRDVTSNFSGVRLRLAGSLGFGSPCGAAPVLGRAAQNCQLHPLDSNQTTRWPFIFLIPNH